MKMKIFVQCKSGAKNKTIFVLIIPCIYLGKIMKENNR